METIHLHGDKVFVHTMVCGVNIVTTPASHKYTFDKVKVTCKECLKQMENK